MARMRSLAAALLLSCVSAAGAATQAGAARAPNVIVIVSDDQGWADTGFNGSADIRTPNLDALAASGVVFSSGYTAHPYCSPARAGLLTGRYQQRFGHETNIPARTTDPSVGLPLGETLLPGILRANGYTTGAIGKWHLGNVREFWPTSRGFDYWYGFVGGGMSYWGEPGNQATLAGVLRNGEIVPRGEQGYLTDDFSREAVRFIERNRDRPFFLYLAYNAPHAPLEAPRAYLAGTEHIENGPRSVYAAMVQAMDAGVGTIRNALEQHGVLENTLIVFFSDNGGHLMGADSRPFRGNKGMLFEGGIRVPFFISWPAGLAAKGRFAEPVIALDVFPTVLAAAGVATPPKLELDGVNLLPYLSGQRRGSPHDVLFWRYSGGAGYAVRAGNHKLVKELEKKISLFDLAVDPHERDDLSETMPGRRAELEAAYASWSREMMAPRWEDDHLPNVRKQEKARREAIEKAQRGEGSR